MKNHLDIFLWVLSLVFLILLVVCIIHGGIVSAILCLILLLLCNPITLQVLHDRKKMPPKWIYIGVVVVLCILAFVLRPISANQGDHVCYWTPNGNSYHFTKDCPTLGTSEKIIKGTVDEALKNGHEDPCNICAGGK